MCAPTGSAFHVITASSIAAYGVCFAEGDRDYTSFPVDEDYDADPTDSHGLSHLVGERLLDPLLPAPPRTFTRFRLAPSPSPLTMRRFRAALADLLSRKRDAWSYIDVHDLA